MKQQKRLGVKEKTQKYRGHGKLELKTTKQMHRLEDLRAVNEGGRHKQTGEKNQEQRLYQGSSSTGGKNNNDKYVLVNLTDLRKTFECSICLGIMRKTRSMTECSHRFCKECIEKSLRLGKKECPTCRTHCPSRRFLRDDPTFDELIARFYPNFDKSEEEEAALNEEEEARNEEEEARNKQVRTSITKAFERRSKGPVQESNRSQESQSSSGDDDADGNAVVVEEGTSTPVQALRLYGKYTWGARRSRGYKRVRDGRNEDLHRTHSPTDHLQGPKRGDEIDMPVIIFSIDDGDKTQRVPPSCHLCKPACPLKLIREFLAAKDSLRADEIEVYLVKSLTKNISMLMSIFGASKASVIDMVKANAPFKDAPFVDVTMEELFLLDYEQTLEQVRARAEIKFEHTILAYRRKHMLPNRGPILL